MSDEDSNWHTQLEIGRPLERARKERGLSLEAVEQATKIRVRYLRALENEDFDVLPAVYMLGSLKTYARHLGLDEAALTREFKHRQALLQEEQNQEETQADEPRGLFASLSRLLGAESHKAGEDDEETVSQRVHSPRLYLSFGVVLIFVFVIALASTLRAEDQPAVSQVHETRISKFPSMIALAGTLGDERNAEDGNKGNQAKSPAKDASKDEKAKQSEQDSDTPQMAQASTSSATASATASASTSASASSGSTASATAKSAGDRPERADAEESSDSAGGSVAAADASAGPSARAHAGPVVQRKQAGPVNAARLRNRITSQAWSVVDGAW